jgi:hypothetical protein
MSDMLNERFGELTKEQNIVLEAGDPMPTVSASVIPGTGKEPSQISDAQTSGAGGRDPQPSVPPTVAIGQKAATDLGGTTTTPHEHDEDGEENPGAKAAAPISQISGDAQQAHQKSPGDMAATPTVGTQVGYQKIIRQKQKQFLKLLLKLNFRKSMPSLKNSSTLSLLSK